VTLDIRGSDGEIPAYTSLAKYLLEGLLVDRFVSKFVDEWDGVLGVWRGRVLGLKSVERHKCDTSCLFFDHDFEDFGSSSVVVDYDVE